MPHHPCHTPALLALPCHSQAYAAVKLWYAAYAEAGEHAAAAMAILKLQPVSMFIASIPPEECAQHYITAAQHALAGDDDATAGQALSLAKECGVLDSDNWLLKTQYRVAFAHVLDAQRKYMQAAVWFHSLVQNKACPTDPTQCIPTEEVHQLLEKAVIAAVLGEPGPGRTRALAQLAREPEVAALPSARLLQKVHGLQFLPPADVSALTALVDDRKKAEGADGLTDVSRAARAHNLAAVARVYSSIKLTALGQLLGMSATEAEQLAARMIASGSMQAKLNQATGTLELGTRGADSSAPHQTALRAWDDRLEALCHTVASTADHITRAHAQLG